MLKPIPDGLVVLTFDDGVKTQATHVAPLLKQYGFGATFYITEGAQVWGNPDHYLTWAEVRALHDDGFEIGNHTRHHRDVRSQTAAELRADLDHIDQRCHDYGIPKPETFCYPAYHNNQAAVSVLADHGFLFARRGVAPEYVYYEDGGRGPAYDPARHHRLLIPTTGAAGPRWTNDDFLWAVDQARDGHIVILTFHGVPELDHPWVHTEPAAFKRYLQTLHDRRCTVISLRDLKQYVAVDSVDGTSGATTE